MGFSKGIHWYKHGQATSEQSITGTGGIVKVPVIINNTRNPLVLIVLGFDWSTYVATMTTNSGAVRTYVAEMSSLSQGAAATVPAMNPTRKDPTCRFRAKGGEGSNHDWWAKHEIWTGIGRQSQH